ncbi:MAG: peptidoglycan DD-metalloendopeptidase family protein [Clostridia bacterium]|nr:peptidoglycan DD-metalloendopeptidase family protein [Clostridia bacterium]
MKKRVVAVVLIIVMFFSMCPIISSAAYDYLFPVNNGGKIAYVYGYSSSYGSRFHSGIDIHSSGDDTIYAAYDGVVGATANSCWHVSCGYQCEHYNTYGNYIRVNQDDGTKAYYGHLLKDSLMVSVGQRVTKGQPIAKMGSSGHSTGKHLHFEVRSGNNKINVNPTSSGGSINYSYSGFGSSGTSPNPTPSPSITYKSIPEGEYKLQNANGKFLGVDSGGNKNGNVHVVNGDSSAEQNFRIKNTEISNQYYIKSLANATQYCVNAYTPDDTLTSQSDVKLWDENKSNSKYWGFEDAGGGYYYIRCMMNPQFVLTADGYNYPENVTVLPFDGRDTQKWKLVEVVKNTEYTITYNANGGSGGPSFQQKNKGQSLTISSEIPERSGYSFVGWSTSATSDEAQYIPGSTFETDVDTTLYAVWEMNVHEHNWIWITDKEATCTANGIRHQECECGATQNEEYIGVFHDFGEWVVVDRKTEYPFTITHQRTCSVCGETEQYLITAIPDNTDEILYGDVNSDGTIDGLDATALLQYLAEWEVDIDFYAADVNADGVIDGLDATLLLQYLAEWDVILGPNK